MEHLAGLLVHVDASVHVCGDAAQNAVDKARGLVGAKGLGKLHGLIDGHGHRDVVLLDHLVEGKAQDVAVHDGHAEEAPACRAGTNHGVDGITARVNSQGELLTIRVERTIAYRVVSREHLLHRAIVDIGLEEEL